MFHELDIILNEILLNIAHGYSEGIPKLTVNLDKTR